MSACGRCGGEGILYDHSSPDPQQWWDRTCPDCRETGLEPGEGLAWLLALLVVGFIVGYTFLAGV